MTTSITSGDLLTLIFGFIGIVGLIVSIVGPKDSDVVEWLAAAAIVVSAVIVTMGSVNHLQSQYEFELLRVVLLLLAPYVFLNFFWVNKYAKDVKGLFTVLTSVGMATSEIFFALLYLSILFPGMVQL